MSRITRQTKRQDVAFRHYVKFSNGEIEMLKPKPRCCEIWMAEIAGNGESVQCGYRPVFIISNDKNNEFAPTVNVFPLTTKIKRNLPCHVVINNYYDCGLTAESVILVEQPMTIPQSWLLKKLGIIEDREILIEIVNAMRCQFPILK